jgi:hypothetical protein
MELLSTEVPPTEVQTLPQARSWNIALGSKVLDFYRSDRKSKTVMSGSKHFDN